MAARHTSIPCPAGEYTPLSDGAVANIRVQRGFGGGTVYILATAANEAPASVSGAIELVARDLLAADTDLSSLFPGVGAGPYYIWAFTKTAVSLSVSHA